MPKQRLNETTETNRLKKDIGARYKTAFIQKIHQGTYGAGLPDLFVIQGGHCYWMEIKVGNNKPTERQANTMAKMRRAGVRVAVVTIHVFNDHSVRMWQMTIKPPECDDYDFTDVGIAIERERGQSWDVERLFEYMDNCYTTDDQPYPR